MHFNIYLDDETGQRLKILAQLRGQTRNALIRQALREWAEVHAEGAGWPAEVLAFEGLPEWVPFEQNRVQLRTPAEDPLA